MNAEVPHGGGPDASWSKQADDRDDPLPKVGAFPVAGLVRRARRIADLSQRQLAKRAGLSPSTVGRIETGALRPTIDTLQHVLACAGLSVVVVDAEGHVVLPMRDVDDIHDGGERRYPSHLDTILDPRPGEWWADRFGLARPPETFHRDRDRRDARRRLSVWQVRVKQNRGRPQPPDLDARDRWQARRREILAMPPHDRPGAGPIDVDVDEWDESEVPPPSDLTLRVFDEDAN